MKRVGDIMFPVSKYIDRQTNEEKTNWAKCGVLLQRDDGKYRIKMDLLPVNPEDGWFAVFEDKPKQERKQESKQEDMDW